MYVVHNYCLTYRLNRQPCWSRAHVMLQSRFTVEVSYGIVYLIITIKALLMKPIWLSIGERVNDIFFY